LFGEELLQADFLDLLYPCRRMAIPETRRRPKERSRHRTPTTRVKSHPGPIQPATPVVVEKDVLGSCISPI
jgi:hypothetical protein